MGEQVIKSHDETHITKGISGMDKWHDYDWVQNLRQYVGKVNSPGKSMEGVVMHS